MTPFQALYGREPPTMACYVLGSNSNVLVEHEVIDLFKHNLSKAHQRMKEYADKKRRRLEFSMGDWVSRPQFTLHETCLLKRIGEVAYKLELPDEARIHPVFHVLMLKYCIGTPDTQVTPLQLKDVETVTPSNLADK
ncbi:hypothetical protein A4A49_59969, partial [Nicotiana attenuata]